MWAENTHIQIQRRKQIQKYLLVIKKISSKVNPQWKVFHLWFWYDLVMLMDVWYIIVGLEIEGNFVEIDQIIEKQKKKRSCWS